MLYSRCKWINLCFHKPEVVFFILSLWIYAFFYQAGGWNQNSRFDLVRSIVEDKTLQIDKYAYNTGDISKVNNHYYCDKAPGVSWIGVIPYSGFRILVSAKPYDVNDLSTASYFVTLFTVAIPSAMAVSILYVFLEIFALSRYFRILITFGYAFGTLTFPYATLFYGHQPAATFLFAAFTLLALRTTQQIDSRYLFGIGILLGSSVAVDYSSMLGVIPISFYAVYKCPKPRQLFFLILGGLCIGAILAIYHTVCFGSPFNLPYYFSVQPHRHQGAFMGIGMLHLDVLYDILFSSYRGLFYSSPWLITGLIGWILASIKKKFIPEMLVSLVIIIVFCWLNASLVDWDGGGAMGPRYLIPILPFLSIGAAGLKFLPIGKNRLVHKLCLFIFILLIGYSSFMMLVATSVNPETPQNFQQPFEDFLLPAFYRGLLSLNTQSIDSRLPLPIQTGPYFAWNVGQIFGLKRMESLIPLGIGVIVMLSWLLYITRQTDCNKEIGSKGDGNGENL